MATTVLNTDGVFSLDLYIVDSFPSSAVHSDLGHLADVLSFDEIRNALSLVAGNKVSGNNGILPEIVKVCSDKLLKYLHA